MSRVTTVGELASEDFYGRFRIRHGSVIWEHASYTKNGGTKVSRLITQVGFDWPRQKNRYVGPDTVAFVEDVEWISKG